MFVVFINSFTFSFYLYNIKGKIINLGDKYNVQPIEKTKAYNGSGSSNTGMKVQTFSGISTADVGDSDANDQGIQFTL